MVWRGNAETTEARRHGGNAKRNKNSVCIFDFLCGFMLNG
jgi:hypothetical protein